MSTILDMPDVVMSHIFKKLDYVSIQNLRKSCRDLRHFIDDGNYESSATEVYVRIDFDLVIFNTKFSSEHEKRIHYQKQGNINYIIGENWKGKLPANYKYMDFACRDVQLALDSKNSGVLKEFHIDLRSSYEPPDQFLESLRKYLASRSHLLKVQEFKMDCNILEHLFMFLPLMDPKKLEYIRIDKLRKVQNFDFSKFLELEQWKLAKKIMLCDFEMDGFIEKFLHFETVTVYIKEITVDMVLLLKEAFLKSPHMQWYKLLCREFRLMTPLYDLLGAPSVRNGNGLWYFRILGDSEKVVSLNVQSGYCVSLERIEMEKVLEGAKII